MSEYYSNMSYVERNAVMIDGIVREWFEWLQDVTGCPVEKEIAENVKKFTLNEATWEARKQLMSILNSINLEHIAEAYIRCDKLTRMWFADNSIRIKDSSDSDAYKTIGEQYVQAGKFISEFNKFKKHHYPELLAAYRQTGLLADSDDVTVDNVGDIACELETQEGKSALTDYLTTYTLKKGRALDFTKPYNVRDVIVCSDSLDYLLSMGKTTDEDTIDVRIGLKIEPIIDYSYFLIFVQQYDTTLVVTDQIQFANPHTAVSSRNPRRRSEQREENTGLPYRIIDDIITWRDETKTVAKEGETKRELYIKKLSEYLSGAGRLLLMKVVDGIIRKIQTEPEYPLVGTYETMLHTQKLIGTTVDTQSERFNDSFENDKRTERAKKYYDSWVMPEEAQTTLPAPIVRDLATIEEYRGDVLVTAENARKMTDYFIAKREADAKHRLVWDYYNEHEDAEKYEFEKILTKTREHILPFIFAGETVYMTDVAHPESVSFGSEHNKLIVRLAQTFYGKKEEENDWYMRWTKFYPSSCLTESRSYKTSYIFNERCLNDTAKCRRKGVQVYFKHWEYITQLLGIGRMDLPQIFRNYMADDYIPYVGNSITQNVNPNFCVTEPLSHQQPNCLTVVYPYCGNCIRKYQKQYQKFKNALIVYDSVEQKVLDIVNYDTYKEESKDPSTWLIC